MPPEGKPEAAAEGLAAALLAVSDRLARELEPLRFAAPVAFVYNPLIYGRAPWALYLEVSARGPKEALFLGMNPGPFGMAQTGVPFGEVALVRDWMGVEAPLDKPPREHPARPVEGFGCARSEVSGARLWGWVRERWGSPGAFFARFWVANYCPLLFVEASGRNRTPDKLPAAERESLFAACDRALAETVKLLSPRLVVGVGGFAAARAREVLAGSSVAVGSILHPSPASPAANRDWAGTVERQIEELGIELPAKP
ncbi:MAG: single-stranded DNA-binding protein [Thermoanaerobaculia bacterium]